MSERFNVRDYIDVQERITRFWGQYPHGRIETSLMSPPDDFTQCRYVARVFKDHGDAHPAATGWAFEIAGGRGANSTSHEENCETSAIGRALANMGYATSGKDRPSQQEMEKANRPAPQPRAVVNAMPTASAPRLLDSPERRVDQRTGEVEDGPVVMANDGQARGIRRLWAELGMADEDLTNAIFGLYSQETPEGLTHEQASEMIASLTKELTAKRPVTA